MHDVTHSVARERGAVFQPHCVRHVSIDLCSLASDCARRLDTRVSRRVRPMLARANRLTSHVLEAAGANCIAFGAIGSLIRAERSGSAAVPVARQRQPRSVRPTASAPSRGRVRQRINQCTHRHRRPRAAAARPAPPRRQSRGSPSTPIRANPTSNRVSPTGTVDCGSAGLPAPAASPR